MEIAEKVFILGVTDSNINLIIDDRGQGNHRQDKAPEQQGDEGGFQSFKDQLLKLISGKAFSGQGQISYFNEFKQRINKMRKGNFF